MHILLLGQEIVCFQNKLHNFMWLSLLFYYSFQLGYHLIKQEKNS